MLRVLLAAAAGAALLAAPSSALFLPLEIEQPGPRGASALSALSYHPPTPRHLETIVLGRCYDANVPGVDCVGLWNLFSQAFTYRASDLDVTTADYDAFFDAPWFNATLAPPRDRAIFWSGVMDVVELYMSATGKYTMEFSPLLRLFERLEWCSSLGGDGTDHEASCPRGQLIDNVWHGAISAFWAQASVRYAKRAEGEITLMFRGSGASHPAYRPTSFFGSCELPNLRYNLVTKVTAVVVPYSIDEPPAERCGEGSLALLEKDLARAGLDMAKFSCVDEPNTVRLILCTRDPESIHCQLPQLGAR